MNARLRHKATHVLHKQSHRANMEKKSQLSHKGHLLRMSTHILGLILSFVDLLMPSCERWRPYEPTCLHMVWLMIVISNHEPPNKVHASTMTSVLESPEPRSLIVQIASYNTNLQGSQGVPQDLVDWLAPTLSASRFREPPDIVAVGFQELLPLHLAREFTRPQ